LRFHGRSCRVAGLGLVALVCLHDLRGVELLDDGIGIDPRQVGQHAADLVVVE
jgi:hypothetical protein